MTRLHPLGPTVLAGSLVYDWKRVRDALRLYAEFSAAAPDELCTDAALVTLPDGGHGFAISAFYAGPMDEGERILRPLRDALPAVQDRIGPISYVQLQKAGDASFPPWPPLLLESAVSAQDHSSGGRCVD